MKYYDVHCHLFTHDILSRTGSSILSFLNRFLSDSKENSRSETDGRLRRISGFIDTALADDARETFEEMDRVYGGHFAVCPLCLDLKYSMIDARPEDEPAVAETVAAAGSSEAGGRGSYWNFRRIVNFFSGNHYSALPNMFADSFISQIEEMERLKARYPDRIYPFFPVDPRRSRDCDLMALIKQKVGPGKPFVGIKLYPALGFSVTDPFLYGSEKEGGGLYAYCEKYSLPIVTHSGFRGYAALAKRIEVCGDIFHTESGRPVPVRERKNERNHHARVFVQSSRFMGEGAEALSEALHRFCSLRRR